MAEVKVPFRDIELDCDTLDLFINPFTGDFNIFESDMQHIHLICLTDLGHWKQFPLVGVGIRRYIASSLLEGTLKRNINLQLTADGLRVNEIIVRGENESFEYSIDAKRF